MFYRKVLQSSHRERNERRACTNSRMRPFESPPDVVVCVKTSKPKYRGGRCEWEAEGLRVVHVLQAKSEAFKDMISYEGTCYERGGSMQTLEDALHEVSECIYQELLATSLCGGRFGVGRKATLAGTRR